jgi:pimeloyl-ACP methyl ester carboxylesterase
MKSVAVVLSLLFLLSVGMLAQPGTSSHWEGDIQVAGQLLLIRVDISSAGDSLRGTIDIPQQNAAGLALRGVRVTKDSISFELPAGPGLATFEGSVLGDSARGVFRQAGFTGAFHLRRGTVGISNQSTPEPLPPYARDEVSFRSGDVSLAGTLSIPASPGPHPAVILLTGSGAQTRDEEVFGFKIFAALADTLTRAGMAVLRFDDRGMGGSTGNLVSTTTRDYAADALAAFEFLAVRPDIKKMCIGFLGHSEGALAAVLAASKQPAVAFLVLMAGPAVRGDKLILSQVEGLGRAAGLKPTDLQDQLSLERRVFNVARSDTGWDSLRELIVKEALRHSSVADSLIRLQVDKRLQAVRTPWFRCFIDLDPAEVLRSTSVPTLALLGEKDMQVPPASNLPVFERLKREGKRSNLTIDVIPGCNHLFQKAETGLPAEYASLRKEFSGEFLRALIPWLVKQGGVQE